MISSNAKTIQKSFTEQAKNFETTSMNFTKQEYLEHMISYPYENNGKIYFNRRWLMMIGKKL